MKHLRIIGAYLAAVLVPLLLARPFFGMEGPHSSHLLIRIFSGGFDWMDMTIIILASAIVLIFVVIDVGGIFTRRKTNPKK